MHWTIKETDVLRETGVHGCQILCRRAQIESRQSNLIVLQRIKLDQLAQ